MGKASMVILEEDHERFGMALGRLREEANARMVFLVDKSGQQVANVGRIEELDPTSLASLAAGNVAATEGLAQLLGEDEFSTLFHEGKHDSLHISVVADRLILVVIFDEHSSLGLVRLRVEQHAGELRTMVEEMLERSSSEGAAALVPASLEITDEDIDALFG